MSKKIYSNIELKATPVLNEHLVNLGTVKNLINKKLGILRPVPQSLFFHNYIFWFPGKK